MYARIYDYFAWSTIAEKSTSPFSVFALVFLLLMEVLLPQNNR